MLPIVSVFWSTKLNNMYIFKLKFRSTVFPQKLNAIHLSHHEMEEFSCVTHGLVQRWCLSATMDMNYWETLHWGACLMATGMELSQNVKVSQTFKSTNILQLKTSFISKNE